VQKHWYQLTTLKMAAYHKKAAESEGRLSNMFYMLF